MLGKSKEALYRTFTVSGVGCSVVMLSHAKYCFSQGPPPLMYNHLQPNVPEMLQVCNAIPI